MVQAMSIHFDRTDFSVVVKKRGSPPKPWRWEIYRAGRTSPIESSSVLYETVEAANRAGKAALKQLLTEFPDSPRQWSINPELELSLDAGRLALGRIHEGENRHVSGIPAVHGLATNLALGVTALLERQISRRHLIFGPAIGTFEDDHGFTMRLRLMT